jgi:hypothetical protein
MTQLLNLYPKELELLELALKYLAEPSLVRVPPQLARLTVDQWDLIVVMANQLEEEREYATFH